MIGHMCLDIIPELHSDLLFQPGSLAEAGPAVLSPGGAVSNVGTVLSRLGVRTGMTGKVGNDAFGRTLQDLLRKNAPSATLAISVDDAANTSYTIVLNLSGQDRMFLHCPGANRTFRSQDVSDATIASARLMHFGYPPLMEAIYADDGRELVDLFQRAKGVGTLTSLDLSLPDEKSPSGQIDWEKFLVSVLPFTDYFLPSLDELAYMIDRPIFEDTRTGSTGWPQKISALADRAFGMGAKNVALKLGDRGLFYRSETGGQFWQPCVPVNVVGTTGSGDATIAGLLAGLLGGLPIQDSLRLACATGARCCEQADAVSGVMDLDQVISLMSDSDQTP